ncbi:GntR family transcriptional regulator [Brevibacterium sp. CFH 10365]|uniref:GntR family transcriptional regulator n=1 Tax=Brevibacterium sp. CFH 10365 TaxID=2585207 RepID=UPI0012662C28|nr:GntR family transcriptional regulator [Brevibacterium sp. CFH 10365]
MTNSAAAQQTDRESIFETVRMDILDGTIKPGTALKEVALAERFGVSRTPIREVLSRLEEASLVSRKARGLEVAAIDTEKIVQVYDARILLEEEVAGQSAMERSIRDVFQLQALLERDRGLENPTDRTLIRSNLEFHAAVWSAAHNPVLEDLLTRLTTHLVHAPQSTLSVGNRWAESLDEHEALIEAIEKRDSARARDIARAHFTTARSLRLDLLRRMVAEQQISPLA